MFNDIFGKKKIAALEKKLDAQEEAKRKKGRTPKEIATENNEPWIDILSVTMDKENPRIGTFEFDWNDQFIAFLKKNGYPQEAEDEKLVDMWYQDVARQVAMETYELADENNKLGYGVNSEQLDGGRKGYF